MLAPEWLGGTRPIPKPWGVYDWGCTDTEGPGPQIPVQRRLPTFGGVAWYHHQAGLLSPPGSRLACTASPFPLILDVLALGVGQEWASLQWWRSPGPRGPLSHTS